MRDQRSRSIDVCLALQDRQEALQVKHRQSQLFLEHIAERVMVVAASLMLRLLCLGAAMHDLLGLIMTKPSVARRTSTSQGQQVRPRVTSEEYLSLINHKNRVEHE